ncbi:hypothetical protein ACFWY5_52635 [Nonomuraea sp. NPDC059007]|uniref:hypothetical protein n=1 Tax=Nonomuraea sp. NPDC059007 TaxID=3346692 RepID=UPI0036A1C066
MAVRRARAGTEGEALHRSGGRGEWVAASSAAAQIPFGALAHLVPDHVPVAAGSVQLMRAIGRRVRQATVLGVDDTHLLDEASSTVIAGLAGVRGGDRTRHGRFAQHLAHRDDGRGMEDRHVPPLID